MLNKIQLFHEYDNIFIERLYFNYHTVKYRNSCFKVNSNTNIRNHMTTPHVTAIIILHHVYSIT